MQNFLVGDFSNSKKKSKDKSNKKKQQKIEKKTDLKIENDSNTLKKAPILEESKLSKKNSLKFEVLAELMERLSNKSERLYKIDQIAEYLEMVIENHTEAFIPSMYLLVGKLSAAFEGIETNIGNALIIKALAQATGKAEKDIRNKLKSTDLGQLAFNTRRQTTISSMFGMQLDELTVVEVFSKLKDVAMTEGQNSQSIRLGIISQMLKRASNVESKFIVRFLVGKMRLGVQVATILNAVANIIQCEYNTLSVSYHLNPSLQEFGTMVLENWDNLSDEFIRENYGIKIGQPLELMAAEPTKDVMEMWERFGEKLVACEWKYDGERAQIHFWREKGVPNIQVYSRHLEKTTQRFPDIVARIGEEVPNSIESFIVDCEVVAFDQNGCVRPFQDLQSRGRKHVKMDDIEFPIKLYVFDLIFYNGKSMTNEEFQTRRTSLRQILAEICDFTAKKPTEIIMQPADGHDCDALDQISELFIKAKDVGMEGLMIKNLASKYESKRSFEWRKLKKDYDTNLADTLDVVPIAGVWGTGGRLNVFGAYIVAVYDPANDVFVSLTKTGTGFSDEFLMEQFKLYEENMVESKPYNYIHDVATKDTGNIVWLEPIQVWEVKAADFTLSPTYKCKFGALQPNKGISVRFNRFERKRPDKQPQNATTVDQVLNMYNDQPQIKLLNQNNANKANNEAEYDEDEDDML
eukprot:TRINITY_DN2883_c0_g1_i1.p1 TRINITY_DN2883_c0_g1~~TRINITY_DN2883_c0_g1_i1.p1  ORF type:complete len:691 (+),score=166.51 TRINITY_DN2883_c0_g1_i1:56-2128(+)